MPWRVLFDNIQQYSPREVSDLRDPDLRAGEVGIPLLQAEMILSLYERETLAESIENYVKDLMPTKITHTKMVVELIEDLKDYYWVR